MSDPIVFESLESSPDTQGDMIATLPAMRARLHEDDEFLIADLPLLEMTLESFSSTFDDVVFALPRLQAFLFEASGDWLLAELAPISATLEDEGLEPEYSVLVAELPLPSMHVTPKLGLISALVLPLPPMQAFLFESGGNWSVMRLPAAGAKLGVETFEVSAILQQSPGVLDAYAPETMALQASAFVTPTAEAAPARLIVNLVERVAMFAEATSRGRFRTEAEEALLYEAIAEIVIRFVSVEDFTVDAIGERTLRQIMAAVEVLQATAIAESKLSGLHQVAAVLVVEALAQRGFRLDEIASVAMQAEAQSMHRAIVAAVEAFEVSAIAEHTLRMMFVADASFAMEAEASSIAHMVMALEEGLLVTAVLRLIGEQMTAWAINAKTDAASQYTGYNYNSMAQYDERHFGLAHDGLYELDGGDELIHWRLKSALIDFGSAQFKRAPLLYLYWSNDGKAYLKVGVTKRDGTREAHWYEVGSSTSAELRPERVSIGQGLESVYYQFTLESIDPSTIDIDSMKYVPVNTGRRS